MGHGGEGAVCMHHSDPLPHKHTAQQREAVEDGGGRGLVVHDLQGEVVDLQAVGQVSDALPPAVGVGGDHHLVSLLDQALGQLVDVTFHAAHVWVEEVGHHADVVLSGGLLRSLCRGAGASLGGGMSCPPSFVHICISISRGERIENTRRQKQCSANLPYFL